MKKTIEFCLLMIFLLVLGSCANDLSENIQNDVIVDNSIQTLRMNEETIALKTYKKALNNEVKILCFFPERYMYLDEYYKDLYEDSNLEINLDFAVIDMDANGVPEVIVSPNFGPGIQEVMHYQSGEIYLYSFSIREMDSTKTDGTFSWSGGGNEGFGKLQFLGKKCESIKLAMCDYSDNPAGDYVLHGIKVTESDYDEFVNVQNQKENIELYEHTESNMNKFLKH